MQKNLLKNIVLSSVLLTLLSACNDVDEGFSHEFSGQQPVTYDGPLLIESDEEQGIIEVDLLSDTSVEEGQTAIIRGLTFISDTSDNYIDDFLAKNGNIAVIDTDLYARALKYQETVVLNFEYWVDTGAGAELDDDGNPVMRDMKVTLNGIYDPVAEFAISHNAVTLPPGYDLTISSIIAPIYATNPNLQWSTGDSSIATVNEQGIVTGVAEGETTLTVSTFESDLQSSIVVEVPVFVTFDISDPIGLSITDLKDNDLPVLNLPMCGIADLKANLLPIESNFTDTFNWINPQDALIANGEMEESERILSVDDNGIVTPLKTGTVVLIANSPTYELADAITIRVVQNYFCAPLANSNFDLQALEKWWWQTPGGNLTRAITTENIGYHGKALHVTRENDVDGQLRFAPQWTGQVNNLYVWKQLGLQSPDTSDEDAKKHKFSVRMKNLESTAVDVNFEMHAWIPGLGSFSPSTWDYTVTLEVSDEWQYFETEFNNLRWSESHNDFGHWYSMNVLAGNGGRAELLVDDVTFTDK